MHLGGVQEIQVDVRIIAATNIDLTQAVTEGKFRDDLYYRLNVITIDLPPLRSRREDIPLLVTHFLKKFSEENATSRAAGPPEALRPLLDFAWPGNVRELENVIERAVVLCDRPERRPGPACRQPSGGACPVLAVAARRPGCLPVRDHGRLRAPFIADMLEKCSWNQTEAAETLPCAAFHAEPENQAAEYRAEEEVARIAPSIRTLLSPARRTLL